MACRWLLTGLTFKHATSRSKNYKGVDAALSWLNDQDASGSASGSASGKKGLTERQMHNRGN